MVTGANGFIGKNLVVRLRELARFEAIEFVRADNLSRLSDLLPYADVVVHLAGENRPTDASAFARVNIGLTVAICNAIAAYITAGGRRIPLVLASSTQAERDNHYGQSKLAAEKAVQDLAKSAGNPAVIFRLPGVFGKWCKPKYNSVVATFCHNVARGIPLQINGQLASLQLVYVDDVVSGMVSAIDALFLSGAEGVTRGVVAPLYNITLGELASQIQAFRDCRNTLMIERVGTGLARALYATYMSHLPHESFAYVVPRHSDSRGVFVEMLKTHDSGQFSYFTAYPGMTRGGHYHHTKTEKFLVIKGHARFGFRHMLTNEVHHLETSGEQPQIVETVPGWTHDITNIGTDEMVVMLWANEIFDRANPDTLASKV